LQEVSVFGRKRSGELEVPPQLTGSASAREAVRVWRAGDRQVFVVKPDVWKDSLEWGLLLMDLARQVAAARARVLDTDAGTELDRLLLGFDSERESPTE